MTQRRYVEHRGVRMAEGWPAQIEAAQKITRVSIHGVSFPRIPYGGEEDDWEAELRPCHDCRVFRDEFHVPGCQVEECPRCHGQLIGCECEVDQPDGANPPEHGQP